MNNTRRRGASPLYTAKDTAKDGASGKVSGKNEATATGASRRVEAGGLESYFDHHKYVAKESLLRMLFAPLASLMTWSVIAIALALPTLLLVLITNLQEAGVGFERDTRISLYLNRALTVSQITDLKNQLSLRDDVGAVTYISSEQALAEFQDTTGLGDVITYLDENPLPAVLVVSTSDRVANMQHASRLINELKQLPGVDKAQLDMQWVERLFAITSTMERMMLVVAVLLALAVILVIGNTIRLAIENRKDEVLVMKMVGGTDAFVRRPFLYTGVWYGLGGGVLAWLIVFICLRWLSGPLNRLSELYFSDFRLSGMGLEETFLLWLLAALLGWSGSWLAVYRHLRHIEP